MKDAAVGDWEHAGGKLLELGADKLTDAELLAIIIGTGMKGKSAEKIAQEILDKFYLFLIDNHKITYKILIDVKC